MQNYILVLNSFKMEFFTFITVCKGFQNIQLYWGKLIALFSTDSKLASDLAMYKTNKNFRGPY
jgi:hypothetical protein